MYEMCKEWNEGYTWAVVGEQLEEHEPKDKLITNVEYPGKYGFTFERAVTAWWIGLWDESMHLFRQIKKMPNVQWNIAGITQNNLTNLEAGTLWKYPITYYTDQHYEHLKVKFPGSATIERNWSQCYQDLFVLTMLNGKRGGRFLEIGCSGPYYANNSVLLEKNFEWTGLAIDIDPYAIQLFNEQRACKVLLTDATTTNFDELLEPGDYDYLQLDCDPPIVTYNALLNMPFETHRFAVITFEHDNYTDEKSDVRKKQRKFLKSMGYELIAGNIAPDNINGYEDWWVHPDLIDKTIIAKMKRNSDKPIRADKYMLSMNI
jgi:hypothetical protein